MKKDLVSEYQEHRKNLERLVKEEAKLQGVLEQILKTLEEEYQCSRLEQAEKLLKEKRRELNKLEKQLTKAVADYEIKWSPLLEKSRS